jgi:hypothetical protein
MFQPKCVCAAVAGYVATMTATPQNPDQDAEPPTPDGSPPDDGESDEPGSHPDPAPDAADGDS